MDFYFFFPSSEGIRPAARWSCCEVSAGRLGQSPRREPVPALGVGGCRSPGQGTLEERGGVTGRACSARAMNLRRARVFFLPPRIAFWMLSFLFLFFPFIYFFF